MAYDADLLCSLSLIVVTAVLGLSYVIRAKMTVRVTDPGEDHPDSLRTTGLGVLQPLVRWVVARGVSASAITGVSLVLGVAGGVSLAAGHFGIAAVAIVLASLGDALDGLVARRSRTATPAGALFDASVDRYEEFFILGGLAIFFRSDARLLALVLASLLGSFMVSYGSAKAEAFCVSVPPGWMRRAERAACFSIGTALVPVAGALARFARLPAWVEFTPVLFALAIVAVVGNVSAIRRLRAVAAAAPSAELARRRLGA